MTVQSTAQVVRLGLARVRQVTVWLWWLWPVRLLRRLLLGLLSCLLLLAFGVVLLVVRDEFGVETAEVAGWSLMALAVLILLRRPLRRVIRSMWLKRRFQQAVVDAKLITERNKIPVAYDLATGQARAVYSTSHEPDGTLLVACGNRRHTRCPTCSWTYRGDAFQLVTAGLKGRKGVPETVVAHPMLFITLTAPSFGQVHSRREREGKVQPCHPTRRPRSEVCCHGVKLVCSRKHAEGDELLGQPLCRDCFDYEGAVLWNALASQLWKRTPTRVLRELAALTGRTVRELEQQVRLAFVKVGETQNRGLIHFHAIVRLDTPPSQSGP